MAKGGKRFGKRRSPASDQDSSWWESLGIWEWLGAGAVILMLIVAIGAVVRNRGQASATPTSTSTPGVSTPASTPEASTPVGTPKASGKMPEGPGERNNMYSNPPEMQIDPGEAYVATISTEKGDIVVELDAGAAPQTVNNFVFLARQGFYDGLTFHRVEPSFVIQGGDPLGDGTGGPGYTVPAEIGLKHVEGAIAMARKGDQVNPERASSGSQFYITLAETPHLDGAYTVFGRVSEGMDVVRSIVKGDLIENVTIAQK